MSIYTAYDRTPYTYLIGWSKFNIWYYGSKYAKHCSPDQLWVTYFTSSEYVASFRKEFGEPDVVQVRRIFNAAEKAVTWEAAILRKLWKHKHLWLNKKFGGSKFVVTSESISRNIAAKRNRTAEYQETVRRNIAAGTKLGHQNMSDEAKATRSENISKANQARPKSVNRKISAATTIIQAGFSIEKKKAIVAKREATKKKNRENGKVYKKNPPVIKVSCLCCRRIFDPGNFSKHIKSAS